MDLDWYYSNNAINTANFVEFDVFTNSMVNLDSRITSVQLANSNAQAILTEMINKLTPSNVFQSPQEEEAWRKWLDVLDPVIGFGGELLDELFRYWLDQQGIRDKLFDLVGDAIGDQIADGADPSQIIDVPEKQVDFRSLSHNPFATDRTKGEINKSYGVTVDRDLNLLSTTKLNVVDPGVIQSNAFGAAYSQIMSDAAKYPILDLSNLSCALKVGTFESNVVVAGSNVLRENTLVKLDSLHILNLAEDPLLGSQVTAQIDNDGAARFKTLNINGNFSVRESGDVLLNGKLIGTRDGRLVVSDEDVIPVAGRTSLSDIQAGNLGAPNIHGFDKNLNQISSADKADPLAFLFEENREVLLNRTHSEQLPTIGESISDATARVQQATGIGDFQRVWSFEDEDEDLFEIDIHTGRVITVDTPPITATVMAPAPLIAEAAPEPIRTDSFSDILETPIENAPLHFLNFGNIFQNVDKFQDNSTFSRVNAFTAEDNAYSIELQQEISMIPTASILDDGFAKLAMRNHIGLTEFDSFSALASRPNVANILGNQ